MNPAATIIRDNRAIIDHMLYWATIPNEQEAYYLVALFNSEPIRACAEKWQSQGQWGARHFDKVVFNLPIPKFDENETLHMELAKVSEEAEKIAKTVPLKAGQYFTRGRKHIREALADTGLATRINTLVAHLLDG
jgi:hypothetical protein